MLDYPRLLALRSSTQYQFPLSRILHALVDFLGFTIGIPKWQGGIALQFTIPSYKVSKKRRPCFIYKHCLFTPGTIVSVTV